MPRKRNLEELLIEFIDDLSSLEIVTKKWIEKGYDEIPPMDLDEKSQAEFKTWLNVNTDLNIQLYGLWKTSLILLPEFDKKVSDIKVHFKASELKSAAPYPKSITLILDKIQLLKRKFLREIKGLNLTNGMLNQLDQSSIKHLKRMEIEDTTTKLSDDIAVERIVSDAFSGRNKNFKGNAILISNILAQHPDEEFTAGEIKRKFRGLIKSKTTILNVCEELHVERLVKKRKEAIGKLEQFYWEWTG